MQTTPAPCAHPGRDTIIISPGVIEDYDALARFHYRAGRPATACRTLAARDITGDLVGVLVTSHPALNGPWRELAWPGEYTHDPAALNRDLRVISRLVVEPRRRGSGVGRALVSAYLAHPLTIRTECIAAMGRYSGLFTSAGMREVRFNTARRNVLLAARLRALHIQPWELTDPDRTLRRIRRAHDAARAFEHALRVFAGAHRDTRRMQHADLRTLITLAARRLSTTPSAFIAESPLPEGGGQGEGFQLFEPT